MTAFATPDPVSRYVDAMMELHAAADEVGAAGQFHSWLGDQLQHHKSNLIDVTFVSPDPHVGAVVGLVHRLARQHVSDRPSYTDAKSAFVARVLAEHP